jgi:protein-S-isoprenylcysteine O-methyltransferase Ste14
MDDRNTGTERRTIILQIGSLKLTGPSVVVVLVGFLAALVVLLVYLKPALSNWPVWASGALWVLFVGYWSAAARNAAPARSSESPESRRLHQRLMNAALLLLFIPVPGLGRRFLPAGSLSVAIGLTVQAAAALLAVWARRHLGRNWSGAITVTVDHQLIRSGPYRLVRHPIYSAMLGMFVGSAVVSGRMHALLAVAIISGAYGRKIRLEERRLHDEFGTAYDDYRRHTWAVVPGVL